ncbi:APC family permease [Dongshaea marina]|uniref:hypothetical protein n=1 Tax=Dongshaea marina TaxID=2047966 RepID=UPI00131F4846|nr:hypothetical protein [Dongshaea marina]
MLTPLPTWQALVAFQSSAIVLSYGLGPICLLALRKQAPELHRPFILPGSRLFSALTFCVCTLIAYWTGWGTIHQIVFAILAGLVLMLMYRGLTQRGKSYALEFTAALWLIPYILGLSLISYLGSFGGGLNLLPFGWDFVVIVLFSLGIFWLACRAALPKEKARQAIYEDPEYQLHAESLASTH